MLLQNKMRTNERVQHQSSFESSDGLLSQGNKRKIHEDISAFSDWTIKFQSFMCTAYEEGIIPYSLCKTYALHISQANRNRHGINSRKIRGKDMMLLWYNLHANLWRPPVYSKVPSCTWLACRLYFLLNAIVGAIFKRFYCINF